VIQATEGASNVTSIDTGKNRSSVSKTLLA
jgi:hypothetical protein